METVLGRTVALEVAPPSTMDLYFGRFVELRSIERSALVANGETCTTKVARYRSIRAATISPLGEPLEHAGIPVFSFSLYLIGEEYCRVEADGRMIYRDKGHLSYEGADFIGREIGLVELLQGLAQ